MTFIQIVQLIDEANAIIQELKADGTLTKIQEAGKALETELAHPSIQKLIAKFKELKL